MWAVSVTYIFTGNNNGNCIGNCQGAIAGNYNGKNNTDGGFHGNNVGNCVGKPLHCYVWVDQGIIIMNRNGNFCKGTWVSEIIAETKVDARIKQKISLFFSRMSLIANLLCFWCFAAW